MVIDIEYEIHKVVYFTLIKNKNNLAYVNKGRIEGFEVSLVNMRPVRKSKTDRCFKAIPIENVFRTKEEADKRVDELNNI